MLVEWFKSLFRPPYPCLSESIVNLRGDPLVSFRGVIWQRRAGFIILKNAQMFRARHEPVAMDGEVLVFEKDIEFIQLL